MARNFPKGCAVLVVLALGPIVANAQLSQPASSAVGKIEKEKDLQQATRTSRITSLLERLADEARASDDLAFAVRAQAQAATLLWSRDAGRASSIYRRAFESLATAPAKSADQKTTATGSSVATPRPELSAARKRQLRSELLNQIAARDPVLAEELAGSVAEKIEGSSRDCKDGTSLDCGASSGNTSSTPIAHTAINPSPTREDTERRELLMSAALQIVEREPQQAMAFAQMSVALGVSPYLARFMTLMRAVDAERADLLFSNVVARLEESSEINLTDVHALGSYVVSVVNVTSDQSLSKELVVRFLNLALNKIARGESNPSAITTRDDSAAYFIGRQLTDLVARYLPERAGQLQRYVANGTGPAIDAGADAATPDVLIDASDLGVRAPADIARDAIEATDKSERESLWARAALGWLARDGLKEAEETAFRISNDATRDRVLIQVVQRYSSVKRIEDALALARRVVDLSLRADVMVMLANGALASGHEGRAVELLNEAATCSASAALIDRARSLIKIAGSFAAFDDISSFDTLQSAIKAINEASKRQQESKDEPASAANGNAVRTSALDDLNGPSLERTLAVLAKSDFDRALSLAQQLPGREASIVAQLAVCKGGLAGRPPVARSTTGDETEQTQNH
jgi:hypothetical protein